MVNFFGGFTDLGDFFFCFAVSNIRQRPPPKLGMRNGEQESIQNGGQRRINGYNLGKSCEEENLECLPDMPPNDQYVLVRAQSPIDTRINSFVNILFL